MCSLSVVISDLCLAAINSALTKTRRINRCCTRYCLGALTYGSRPRSSLPPGPCRVQKELLTFLEPQPWGPTYDPQPPLSVSVVALKLPKTNGEHSVKLGVKHSLVSRSHISVATHAAILEVKLWESFTFPSIIC